MLAVFQMPHAMLRADTPPAATPPVLPPMLPCRRWRHALRDRVPKRKTPNEKPAAGRAAARLCLDNTPVRRAAYATAYAKRAALLSFSFWRVDAVFRRADCRFHIFAAAALTPPRRPFAAATPLRRRAHAVAAAALCRRLLRHALSPMLGACAWRRDARCAMFLQPLCLTRHAVFDVSACCAMPGRRERRCHARRDVACR